MNKDESNTVVSDTIAVWTKWCESTSGWLSHLAHVAQESLGFCYIYK